MKALAEKVEGTRVILSGLGVGVRSGTEFVLFDRVEEERPHGTASATYGEAVRWFAARGITVSPAEWAQTRFGVRLRQGSSGQADAPTGQFDHLAFAADDLGPIVERLRAAGAAVERRGDDVVVVDGNIEIVRDTGRPDAFWCPMHLDVRAPTAGTCAICGMDLVPIPPPRLGEYRLDVTLRGSRTLTGLRLRISDPDGQPVEQFATVHERPLHLFIVNRALDYFAHVHPQPSQSEKSTFEVTHPLPPGEYMLLADFLPYGGTSQMLQRAIVTPGFSGALFGAPPQLTPSERIAVVDGVRVVLEGELAPRKDLPLRFTLLDAATGAPLTDLEPYLGAPAHLLIVKADLSDAIHAHPAAKATIPVITFDPLIPASGVYKMWLQFQRKGHVSTAAFVIRVD